MLFEKYKNIDKLSNEDIIKLIDYNKLNESDLALLRQILMSKTRYTSLALPDEYKSFTMIDLSYTKNDQVLQCIMSQNGAIYAVDDKNSFYVGTFDSGDIHGWPLILFEAPRKNGILFDDVSSFYGKVSKDFKSFGGVYWKTSKKDLMDLVEKCKKRCSNMNFGDYDCINDEKIENIGSSLLLAYKNSDINNIFSYILDSIQFDLEPKQRKK